jgi:hypothetical protein
MNNLALHRVLIGILVLALGITVFVKTGSGAGGGRDGNPSGFDVTVQSQIKVYPQGEENLKICLESGAPCPLYVALHYLNTPAPICSDANASNCPSPLPNPAPTRSLQPCRPDLGQTCFSVNTNEVANGTPLKVEIQNDDEGWKSFPDNGQFLLILSTTPIADPAKISKTEH